MNAQFSIETEQLAFSIRPEMGEVDGFIVYPNPDIGVLEKLKKSKTRTELWENLPTELEYNKQVFNSSLSGIAYKEKSRFEEGMI